MEALVTGFILAGVSGLTFLAYKHPKTYRLLLPLLWALLCGVGGWMIFGEAFSISMRVSSIEQRSREVPEAKLGTIAEDAKHMKDSVKHEFLGLIIVGATASYFAFLYFLPGVIRETEKKQGRPNPQLGRKTS